MSDTPSIIPNSVRVYYTPPDGAPREPATPQDLLVYASVGGGRPHVFQLDTGSCGIVVSNRDVGPEYQQTTGPVVPVHYMPSEVNHEGYLIQMPVALLGPDGAPQVPGITATVPVVVVHDPAFMGGMMGIGYHETPERNPLLHAVVDDGAGGTQPLSPGYILTPDYVEVGLTEQNQAGFAYADLQPDPEQPGEWMGPPASITLSGPDFAQPVTLTLPMLMDTGVPLMMFFADPAQLPPEWAGASQASQITVDTARVQISVAMPATGEPLVSYTFGAGRTALQAPEMVEYMGQGNGLNTGIHVMAVHDYLYDAANQRVGYRRRPGT